MKLSHLLIIASALALLSACGGAPSGPSTEPPEFSGVKIGAPYSIAGKWYEPKLEADYDKTGMASWYGPGFNGKRTANGEVYNQHDLTAAHTTLPMPSFVRVTNLANGRQAVVRVNDRGPFHGNRIIDLSEAAARKLGVVETGTAKVRVKYLKEATEIHIASNGKIWPDELLKEQTEWADNVMPREKLPALSEQQEVAYYDTFTPVPLEAAQTTQSVVDAAPVLSVQSSPIESRNLPQLIKPAVADEAPYPSALNQQNLSQWERSQSVSDAGEGENNPHPSQALPSPTSPDVRGEEAKNWSLQVASFSARANAEKLMQQLMELGQPELQPVLIDGKEWFRVYLHPKSLMQQPEELLAQLQKIGLQDARIVP